MIDSLKRSLVIIDLRHSERVGVGGTTIQATEIWCCIVKDTNLSDTYDSRKTHKNVQDKGRDRKKGIQGAGRQVEQCRSH